jgi:short-subunit dehydrogenase
VIVFVTGSTGFVGRVFLAKLLRHLGPHDVVRVLTRKPFDSTDSRLQPVIGDLQRVAEWTSTLRDVNWVFHLGANATFGDGEHYHAVNVEPVRQMAAALAHSSVLHRFVFISSIGAVDRSPQDRIRSPLNPQSLPHPTSDYGDSKLAAEQLVRESGLPYTVIRPGWVYGAGMRSESHLNALAAVVFRSPWIASLAFPGRVPLIHVSDLADALVRCIDAPESANRTYIAVSENRTVGEIVAVFHNALHGTTRRQLPVPWASRIVKLLHAWLPLKINVLFSDYLAANDAAFIDALLPTTPILIDKGSADIVAAYREPEGWWIITGANSGIGLALTHALARRGKPVIAVDRVVDQLTESDSRQVIRADLGNPYGIEQVAAAVKPRKLAGLVNNAGVGFKGLYVDTSSERHEATVAVNVLAPLRLTHALLPQLKSSQATIVNIASSVAYHPLPGMATYAASKAFILSWSLALGDELRRTNHVVTFSPSGTNTQFQSSGGVKGSQAAGLHDPQDVASAVLRAVDRRKRHTLFGWRSRLLVFASRFLPTTQRLSLWRLLFTRLR